MNNDNLNDVSMTNRENEVLIDNVIREALGKGRVVEGDIDDLKVLLKKTLSEHDDLEISKKLALLIQKMEDNAFYKKATSKKSVISKKDNAKSYGIKTVVENLSILKNKNNLHSTDDKKARKRMDSFMNESSTEHWGAVKDGAIVDTFDVFKKVIEEKKDSKVFLLSDKKNKEFESKNTTQRGLFFERYIKEKLENTKKFLSKNKNITESVIGDMLVELKKEAYALLEYKDLSIVKKMQGLDKLFKKCQDKYDIYDESKIDFSPKAVIEKIILKAKKDVVTNDSNADLQFYNSLESALLLSINHIGKEQLKTSEQEIRDILEDKYVEYKKFYIDNK